MYCEDDAVAVVHITTLRVHYTSTMNRDAILPRALFANICHT